MAKDIPAFLGQTRKQPIMYQNPHRGAKVLPIGEQTLSQGAGPLRRGLGALMEAAGTLRDQPAVRIAGGLAELFGSPMESVGGPVKAWAPLAMGKLMGPGGLSPYALKTGQQARVKLIRAGEIVPGQTAFGLDADQVPYSEKMIKNLRDNVGKGMSQGKKYTVDLLNPAVFGNKADSLLDLHDWDIDKVSKITKTISRLDASSGEATRIPEIAKRLSDTLGLPADGIAQLLARYPHSAVARQQHLLDMVIGARLRSGGYDSALFKSGATELSSFSETSMGKAGMKASEFMLLPEAAKRATLGH